MSTHAGNQRPRRLGIIGYSPGRKLTEFLVTVDNVPGAMGKVSSMCGSLGVNILSGHHSSEADNPHMIWHFFGHNRQGFFRGHEGDRKR